MAEVKIIYRPYKCKLGGNNCKYPNCRSFNNPNYDLLSDDGEYICKYMHRVANSPNVIVKNVKNFEWEGLDAYFYWEVKVGRETLNCKSSELIRIQVDGETIYEEGEPLFR